FPEPALVPLEPSRELVDRLRDELPELPGERIRGLAELVGFDAALDLVSTGNERKARLLVEHALDWPTAANVAMNQLAAIDPLPENAPALVEIIKRRDSITREAYAASLATSGSSAIDVSAVLAQTAIGDASEL